MGANVQTQVETQSQKPESESEELDSEEMSNETQTLQRTSESPEAGDDDDNSPSGGAIQRQEESSESEDEEISPEAGAIQRQEESSESEDDQMKSVQTKLTIGAPGDKYEQEADQMAERVMSMNAPANPQSIQRQSEGEEEVQRSPLAASITPLIQRFSEEDVQTKSSVQRAGESGASQAGASLESRLSSQKGGGSPLDDEVKSFMEPRFGTDFSSVRIHTGGDAVSMNKELHAQAFAHGSDIYFNAGKYNPTSNEGKRLLAHELTHVVQQTGAKQLQPKQIPNIQSKKETPQAKINPAFSSISIPEPKIQLLENPQQSSNKHELSKGDTQTLHVQPKCAACAQEESVQTIQPKENPPQQLSNKDELPKADTQTLHIQPKCAACSEEEQVQRQPIVGNTISQAEGDTTVQRLSWEDVKNTASAGANWVGDRANDVASLGKDAFASLVARVAPGLADLIRSGPVGLLTEKIKEGIKGWLSGVMANVDVGSVITSLKSNFAGVFETIKGLGKGDPASCAAFAHSIKSLQEMGQAFMDSAAIKQLQAAFTQVSGIFKKVSDLVIAPAFDALMSVAGGVFNAVKGLATTIWQWGAPVRNTLGAAWDWVKQQLGFGGDGEGGILNWLKTKASAAWTQIKEPLAPVIGPLKTVGTVLLAFSPVGQVALIIKFVPQLVQSVQWLWAHKDEKDIVKKAHEQMGNTILPGLLSAVQGFSNAVQSTVTGLVSQAVQLSEAVLGLLGVITGVPLLNMAQSLVQTVSNGVKELVVWGQEAFQSASPSVIELVGKIKAKIEPYAGVLSSLALAIANPAMIPVILAGSAWRMLDDCYKAPIINFLLDTVIGLLKAAPSLPMFGLLWPMIKAGVIGFLEGVKGKPDNEKVAITNKLAKIISGGSPAFILGFVKGLLKGIWEGLSDPFVLIYEAIKGLGNLVTWLNDVANQALSPTPTGEKPASAQAGAASPATANNKNVEMGQRMQQMAGELEPPVQQVSQGFMPAVQEVFSGGGGMSFEQLMQKLGDAWAGVETAIRNAGGTLADKVCQFMLQDSAEGEMGETVGWLAGTIAFEVVLGILTAGSWTAAKGAMKGLKLFAKILDWTGEAMGLAFKGLAKVGGFILDGIKGLGKLLDKAGGAAKAILDALGEIGQKLISFADELLGRAAKGAAGEVVEEGAEKAAKETAEAGAEKATKEAVETGAEKGAKEGVEEGAEKGAKEGAEEGAEKSTKETTDDAAKKAAELPAAMTEARTITEINDAIDTPAPVLVGILNSTVKPKYSWLQHFEAEPKGMPGHYSIYMIASKNHVGDIEPNQGGQKATNETAEQGAEQGSKQTAEQGAEQTTKQTTEEGVEQGAEQGVKEGVEEGAEKSAKEGTEQSATQIGDEVAEKAVKEAEDKAAKEGSEKVTEKISEPHPNDNLTFTPEDFGFKPGQVDPSDLKLIEDANKLAEGVFRHFQDTFSSLSKSERGPVLAGVLHRETGIMKFDINQVLPFKDVVPDLHKVFQDRLTQYLQEAQTKGLKNIFGGKNILLGKELPGIHAEVKAASQVLHALEETLKRPATVEDLNKLLIFNIKINPKGFGESIIRCPNCQVLTRDILSISDLPPEFIRKLSRYAK